MKCPFCSQEFDEKASKKACPGCGKSSGCNMIKCPRCGYEMPPEPEWAKRLKNFFDKER